MRRMDRYHDQNQVESTTRSRKNKDLYQNIGSNQRYTNVEDVTNANAYDLTNMKKNQTTREGYHHMKEYQTVVPVPKVKRELDEFNHLYQDHENKIYDINSVLEEARKNRLEKDELEAKRKLKNTNYNILASLNPKELEEYRKEKKERVIKPDEGELRELIDTITSKTLAGEIDRATSVDLLSDLMATNIMDKVEGQKQENNEENKESEVDEKLALSKEILDKDQIEKMKELKEKPKSKMEDADTEFYTRSMDLSDKDFDFGDFSEKKVPLFVKILLGIILIAVIAVAIYFVIQNM